MDAPHFVEKATCGMYDCDEPAVCRLADYPQDRYWWSCKGHCDHHGDCELFPGIPVSAGWDTVNDIDSAACDICDAPYPEWLFPGLGLTQSLAYHKATKHAEGSLPLDVTFSPEGETKGHHLGGPDDNHYAKLAIQPLEATEAWSKTWPSEIAYHLGESVAMIARCGTKGQLKRDLKKAAFLLNRAVEKLE